MTFSIKRRHLVGGGLALPLLVGTPAAHGQMALPRASFEQLLRPTVHTGQEHWSLADRMAHYRVPGVAVAILRGGRVEGIHTYGSRIAGRTLRIGANTIFSVGSVSKVATAALVLRLVAIGRLDLDRDVRHWLRRWRVPEGPAGDRSAITLRMLLSHTGGFSLHGFRDFAPDTPLPTLVQTLNGAAPAPNGPLRRIDPAGTRARYSGGGYLLIQAIVEDAMGQPLDVLAREHVFAPLGMHRSRFDAAPAPATVDIAHAHDQEGRPAALPRGWQGFPELAPSGLWASAGDLALLVQALYASYRGASTFLPAELAVDMMTPVSPGTFGLGPRLSGAGEAEIFHHAGANDSYKAYVEGNLASGDGLVILTNGANGDVLGDEIRNGVSDAMQWPGDWSVRLRDVELQALSAELVGTYRRRPGQSAEIAGMLDASFEGEIVIGRTSEGVDLRSRGRSRALAPLSSSRFVAPDAYVPAGTLQVAFKRNAHRSVDALVLSGGADTLVFDKVAS